MNRIQRMNATLFGGQPDRAPVAMWYHFDPDLTAEQAADMHFDYVQEVDLDVIKIMYDNAYLLDQKIEKASDWYNIRPLGKDSPYFRKQSEILQRLLDKGKGEYPIWITMFGAFKFAVMATDDATVMAHSKEDPDAVSSGVRAIADCLCEWADGYLSQGADGIFYSAQFGEIGRFTRQDWEKLVRPHDLAVMNIAEKQSGKYNILHLCGEPEYEYKVHLDRFADYPGAMINWAIYPNNYEIERGIDLFQRPILGGLDNHGVMAHGTNEEVTEAVEILLDKYGTLGFAVGADCSIESELCKGRIKAAIDASKAYGA